MSWCSGSEGSADGVCGSRSETGISRWEAMEGSACHVACGRNQKIGSVQHEMNV